LDYNFTDEDVKKVIINLSKQIKKYFICRWFNKDKNSLVAQRIMLHIKLNY
jgi:hypothetical protein